VLTRRHRLLAKTAAVIIAGAAALASDPVSASAPIAGSCAVQGNITFTPGLTTSLTSGVQVGVSATQIVCVGVPAGFTVQISLQSLATANCAGALLAGAAGTITFTGAVETVSGSYAQGPGGAASLLLSGNLGFQAILGLAWNGSPCATGTMGGAPVTGVFVFTSA
jgi:hypothetical protein